LRIVLDTNVLVSALLSPEGSSARIVDLIIAGEIRLVFDDRIFHEYREVLLRKKFNFQRDYIGEILHYIFASGEHIISTPFNIDLSDKGDLPFLECALSGEVEHLITGNKKHFPSDQIHNVKVLSPAEFLDIWILKIKKTRKP